MNSSNETLAALAAHAGSTFDNQRRLDRAKAVLPVRISGNDVSGESYSELVHTLDVSRNGVRLGSVHRQLEVGAPEIGLQADGGLSLPQGRGQFVVISIVSGLSSS